MQHNLLDANTLKIVSNNLLNSDTLLGTIVGSILGLLSSLMLRWYDKHKAPKEQEADITESINKAALDNVTAAKTTNEMQESIITRLDQKVQELERRLDSEREYNDNERERSKKDCLDKIANLTDIIERFKNENQKLSIELAKQTLELEFMKKEYAQVKKQVNQHEQLITGDHINVMKLKEEEAKRKKHE